MKTRIILTEKQGNHGETKNLIVMSDGTSSGNKVVLGDFSEKGEKHFNLIQRLKHFLVTVFLPDGFPNSVSSDYVSYQIWDTLQAFASSLTGALSTRAVLEGVGVGSSTSTPLAATMTWLIKDGTGMLGRIGFAWWKGTLLDADCKKWRLFADILNDAAMCVELCAPFVHSMAGGSGAAVTGLLCVAGSAKAIVGVAGGATRAALTQHQARCGNLADVSAKDGSQETIVNLVALLTSLWLIPLVGDSISWTWCLFVFFTILHLYANYRAVRSVSMPTFNRSRFLILLSRYFSTKQVLSVEKSNYCEPVFLGSGLSEEDVCGYKVLFGDSSTEELANLPSSDVDQIFDVFDGKVYVIVPNISRKFLHVIFHKNSQAPDFLEAYYNALLLGSVLSGKVRLDEEVELHDTLKNVVSNNVKDWSWTNLKEKLTSRGWSLTQSLLTPGEWRANWEKMN